VDFEGKLKIMDGFVTEEHFRILQEVWGRINCVLLAMRFEIGLQMATRFACRLTGCRFCSSSESMLLLQDSAQMPQTNAGNVFFKHVRTVRELRLKTKPDGGAFASTSFQPTSRIV